MKKSFFFLLAFSVAILMGQATDFSYTGGMQTYTVPAGAEKIKLEVWGAQGGGNYGGKGGYAVGELVVSSGQVLNIYVGELGKETGGRGSGGGASDVRLISGAWYETSSLNSRIIVGAGGGGSGYAGIGGFGGGTTGGDGAFNSSSQGGQFGLGATQGAGGGYDVGDEGALEGLGAMDGSFGYGGDARYYARGTFTDTEYYEGLDPWVYRATYGAYNGGGTYDKRGGESGGGGGGWYGGGSPGSGDFGGGGGGGSSYIDGVLNGTTTAGQRAGDGFVTITVVNDLPTLTAFSGFIDTVDEDTEVEITFAELAAKGNEADSDGTVDGFKVVAISTGTLKIGTSAGAATAYAAATNDVVDGTQKAYWTGANNDNGLVNAFTVKAVDNEGDESISPIQATVQVNAINDAPTLTTYSFSLDIVNEDTEVEIDLSELKSQGDAADIDGTVDAFRISSVVSGTLKIGTNSGTATAYAASSNDIVDATKNGYWTPANQQNGNLDALSVVAIDDDGAESSTPVTAKVSVTAVNDAPVNSLQDYTITIDEDHNYTFNVANSSRISVADGDSGSDDLKITLTTTNGVLSLSSTAGLFFQSGDGADDALMVFEGTWGEINNSIDNLLFKPNSNFNGIATITLNTSDQGYNGVGGIKTDEDVVTITVNDINDIPTLTAFAGAIDNVNEDTEVEITLADLKVQGDESDVDGTVDAFLIAAVSTGSLKIGTNSGSATAYNMSFNAIIDGAKNGYWTPDVNSNGLLNSFTTHVLDNDDDVSISPVQAQIQVNAVNDSPIINDVTDKTTNEDTPISAIAVTLSDIDANTMTLTGASSNQTLLPNDSIKFAGTGDNRTVVLYPALNQSGTATITLTVNDGQSKAIATDTFVLTVNAVNDAPIVSVNNGLTLNEGTGSAFNPLILAATDVDYSDELLVYKITQVPVNGFVGRDAGHLDTLMVDDTFTQAEINDGERVGYIHNGTETASDMFKFTLMDDNTETAEQVFNIIITPQNDAPVITGQETLTTLEETALEIKLSDLTVTDPDNTYPTGFSLTVNGGTNYTVDGTIITPVADFNGDLTVGVLVNDGVTKEVSNTYDLTVTVTAVNDAPVITGQEALTTLEDTTLEIKLSDLTVTDPDNTYPTGFSLTVNGGANYTVDGTTITPVADYNGDLIVGVLVNDGVTKEVSNTYDLTVTVTAVNDAPVITGQETLTTLEDTVLEIKLSDLTVIDPDNTYPTGFSLTVNSGTNYTVDGTTITPVADYNGDLTVQVSVNDNVVKSRRKFSKEMSNTYDLTVSVTAVNDAPVITGQETLTTLEDTALEIKLSDLTVIDPDNTYPTGFSLTVNSGTNYTVDGTTITPVADFNGDLTVQVSVDDNVVKSRRKFGKEMSNTYDLTVSVTAVNDAPVITGQEILTTLEDTALEIKLSDLTVTDPDNTYPTGFSLTVNSGTNYTVEGTTITPVANYNGDLTVGVSVNDGVTKEVSNTYDLTVTVTAVNDAPVITGQEVLTTLEDTDLEIKLSDLTVTDPDNTYPDDFTLTVNAGTNYTVDGTTITPVAEFVGNLTVPVSVDDNVVKSRRKFGKEMSNTFSLTVSVTAVNDAPVITGQGTLATREDTALEIKLSNLSVTDPDNTYPIGFSLTVNTGANYTVDGTTIMPAADFYGDLTVPVYVNDGVTREVSNTFDLTVSVAAVNDLPEIVGYTPEEDHITIVETDSIDFSVEVTDVEDDVLVYQWFKDDDDLGVNTAEYRYISDYNSAGEFDIICRISEEGVKAGVERVWHITVTNMNRAPFITAQVPEADSLTVYQDSTMVLSITAEDPDGDELGYTWLINGTVMSDSTESSILATFNTVGEFVVSAVVADEALSDTTHWYVTVEEDGAIEEIVPQFTNLYQNYPNPFNPSTTIKFYNKTEGFVKLSIFNVKGEQVAILRNGKTTEGFHSFNFDASSLNSGLYYYHLQTPDKSLTRKMMMVK